MKRAVYEKLQAFVYSISVTAQMKTYILHILLKGKKCVWNLKSRQMSTQPTVCLNILPPFLNYYRY
jgi:hypothetical protein